MSEKVLTLGKGLKAQLAALIAMGAQAAARGEKAPEIQFRVKAKKGHGRVSSTSSQRPSHGRVRALAARRRQKASRAEQRRKGVYGRAQA